MNKLDIRTLLIVMMAIVIVCMGIFGKGGGDTTALETLVEEKEKENALLEEQIQQRNDTISMLKDSAVFYMEQDKLKGEIIMAMEELREKQKRDIDFLKSKLKQIPQQVDTASDQRRMEFWREYFRKRGIKP